MNWKARHSAGIVRHPFNAGWGIQTLCMALLLCLVPSFARADCPTAPIGDPDDMAISFLKANAVQAASASLLASTVKEGTLIYDDSANKLKICDGDNWIAVGSGSSGTSQWQDGTDGTIYYNAGAVGIGTSEPWGLLHVEDTSNIDGSVGYFEAIFEPSLDSDYPGKTGVGSYVTSIGAGEIDTLRGMNGYATSGGSNDVFWINGGDFEAWTEGTGTVGTLAGLYSWAGPWSASSVSDAYSIYADSGSANGGTITNLYGVYIADTSAVAGVTNAYNLYSNGGGRNYFGGRVGIGTTGPALKLDIVGTGGAPATSGTSENGALRMSGGGAGVLDMGVITGGVGAWLQSTRNNDLSMHDPLLLQPNGGSVGIGTATPNASALLDVTSTDKGFLPPRMTTAQRDAISSPSTGLMVFNTATARPEYWDGSGWIQVGSKLVCPAGFTKLTGGGNTFGCLQTVANTAVNYSTAQTTCLSTYGAELPSFGRRRLAAVSFSLSVATGDEWVDSSGAAGSAGNCPSIDTGNTGRSDSCTTTNAYRCFIAAGSN